MKFFKLVTILILSLLIILVAVTLHPDIARHLENNFKNNLARSFADSDMQTQLNDLEISVWPLLIKWQFLNIARNSKSKLPHSWLQIFQSIKFSNCALSISQGWFRLNAELQCKKINVGHQPLRWFHVESLNSALSTDFYFVHSDFRTLEGKQGWLNMTVKADNLVINGKTIRSLHLNYYFSSRTELVIEWPELKEKMLIINEPEQLRIVHFGVKENYSFLNQSLHSEIKWLWQNSL